MGSVRPNAVVGVQFELKSSLYFVTKALKNTVFPEATCSKAIVKLLFPKASLPSMYCSIPVVVSIPYLDCQKKLVSSELSAIIMHPTQRHVQHRLLL